MAGNRACRSHGQPACLRGCGEAVGWGGVNEEVPKGRDRKLVMRGFNRAEYRVWRVLNKRWMNKCGKRGKKESGS